MQQKKYASHKKVRQETAIWTVCALAKLTNYMRPCVFREHKCRIKCDKRWRRISPKALLSNISCWRERKISSKSSKKNRQLLKQNSIGKSVRDVYTRRRQRWNVYAQTIDACLKIISKRYLNVVPVFSNVLRKFGRLYQLHTLRKMLESKTRLKDSMNRRSQPYSKILAKSCRKHKIGSQPRSLKHVYANRRVRRVNVRFVTEDFRLQRLLELSSWPSKWKSLRGRRGVR